MVKLCSKNAYDLLTCGTIVKPSDFKKNENYWINHSLYVGHAAQIIAKKLNIDDDYAMALGYIHDIGRKISHKDHIIVGYKYLYQLGYEYEWRVCLTHSFIDNNILLTCGDGPSGDVREFIMEYLNSIDISIYDNIIQLCDLFCMYSGYTTIEKRLLDIYTRKNVSSNAKQHYDSVLALKERLEQQMGCSLYSLFPKINKKDLVTNQTDVEKLLRMFDNEKVLMKKI